MYDIQQNGLDKQENNNNNHSCTQTQNVTYLCCDQFGPHSTIDFTRVGRFNENCFSRVSRVGDQLRIHTQSSTSIHPSTVARAPLLSVGGW